MYNWGVSTPNAPKCMCSEAKRHNQSTEANPVQSVKQPRPYPLTGPANCTAHSPTHTSPSPQSCTHCKTTLRRCPDKKNHHTENFGWNRSHICIVHKILYKEPSYATASRRREAHRPQKAGKADCNGPRGRALLCETPTPCSQLPPRTGARVPSLCPRRRAGEQQGTPAVPQPAVEVCRT